MDAFHRSGPPLRSRSLVGPSLLTLALLALLLASGAAGAQEAAPQEGQEGEVPLLTLRAEAAPIAPDGLTAGRPTDFVLIFPGDAHPAAPGRSLPPGGTIRVTLPQAFERVAELPLVSVNDENCAPAAASCNTAVLLQGWPQNPIRPFERYPLSFDGTHTVVFTAPEGIEAPTDSGPGIKSLHLLLFGYRNPDPGRYLLRLEADTGPDGTRERGVAVLEVVASSPPTVAPTSALSERPGSNLLYQRTRPGEAIPLPFDLLLWGADEQPLAGVTLEDDGSDADGARLMHEEREIGRVTVLAPEGASGQRVSAAQPSQAIASPVSGVPAGHLRVDFQAGSEPGAYLVTFALDGGNELTMVVTADEAAHAGE